MVSFVWVITILISKLYTLHIIYHSMKIYDQVVSKVQHCEIINFCKECQYSLLFRLVLKRSKAHSSDFYHFGLKYNMGKNLWKHFASMLFLFKRIVWHMSYTFLHIIKRFSQNFDSVIHHWSWLGNIFIHSINKFIPLSLLSLFFQQYLVGVGKEKNSFSRDA